MNDNTNKSISIKELLSSDKASKWIVIVGIIGILLVFISSFWGKKSDNTDNITTPQTITSEEYISQLENKLSYIISSINGAGKTAVMVTLENGIEYVYAQEEKQSQDRQTNSGSNIKESDNSQKNYIIVDGGKGKQPIIITQIEPKVKGVVVVCQGGDNIEVKENILTAVMTALNISSSEVSISKLTN